jgi:hypothetical protein
MDLGPYRRQLLFIHICSYLVLDHLSDARGTVARPREIRLALGPHPQRGI